MLERCSVRFPGRVCLLGEHCDWAGGASLAAPLAQGVSVLAERAPGSRVALETVLEGRPTRGSWPLAGGVDRAGGPLRFVPAALSLLRDAGVRVPGARLQVRSDLPAGRGFSSSAAFTLSVLDALARLAGRAFDPEALARMAFEVENRLLGVECGLLDQLVSASGAPVLIRWGDDHPGGYRLERVDPGGPLHLLVGSFSAPRDTAAILAALNADHRAGGRFTAPVFRLFADAAERAAVALADHDAAGLGAQMDRAQAAYEEGLAGALPGLAAPLLTRACSRARELGALGAKFSGAGGDGSLVALFESAEAADRAGARLAAELPVDARRQLLAGDARGGDLG